VLVVAALMLVAAALMLVAAALMLVAMALLGQWWLRWAWQQLQ
jgi:hypothetical protein